MGFCSVLLRKESSTNAKRARVAVVLFLVAVACAWVVRASAGIQVRLGDSRLVEEFSVGADVRLEYISGVVASSGGRVFVCDWGASRVVVFDDVGNYITEFRTTAPSAIAIDGNDRIAIASFGGVVSWFDTTGTHLDAFPNAFEGLARALKVSRSGELVVSYVDSAERAAIRKYDLARNVAWSRSFESGTPEGLPWEGWIYAGAFIDVSTVGEVYVSRLVPCGIDVLTVDGKSRSEVACERREAAEGRDDNKKGVLFMHCVTSSILVLDDGRVVHSIVVPFVGDSKGNAVDGRLPETFLELMGPDLEVTGRVRQDHCLSMEFQDKGGGMFAVCNERVPVVRRFHLIDKE